MLDDAQQTLANAQADVIGSVDEWEQDVRDCEVHWDDAIDWLENEGRGSLEFARAEKDRLFDAAQDLVNLAEDALGDVRDEFEDAAAWLREQELVVEQAKQDLEDQRQHVDQICYEDHWNCHARHPCEPLWVYIPFGGRLGTDCQPDSGRMWCEGEKQTCILLKWGLQASISILQGALSLAEVGVGVLADVSDAAANAVNHAIQGLNVARSGLETARVFGDNLVDIAHDAVTVGQLLIEESKVLLDAAIFLLHVGEQVVLQAVDVAIFALEVAGEVAQLATSLLDTGLQAFIDAFTTSEASFSFEYSVETNEIAVWIVGSMFGDPFEIDLELDFSSFESVKNTVVEWMMGLVCWKMDIPEASCPVSVQSQRKRRNTEERASVNAATADKSPTNNRPAPTKQRKSSESFDNPFVDQTCTRCVEGLLGFLAQVRAALGRITQQHGEERQALQAALANASRLSTADGANAQMATYTARYMERAEQLDLANDPTGSTTDLRDNVRNFLQGPASAGADRIRRTILSRAKSAQKIATAQLAAAEDLFDPRTRFAHEMNGTGAGPATFGCPQLTCTDGPSCLLSASGHVGRTLAGIAADLTCKGVYTDVNVTGGCDGRAQHMAVFAAEMTKRWSITRSVLRAFFVNSTSIVSVAGVIEAVKNATEILDQFFTNGVCGEPNAGGKGGNVIFERKAFARQVAEDAEAILRSYGVELAGNCATVSGGVTGKTIPFGQNNSVYTPGSARACRDICTQLATCHAYASGHHSPCILHGPTLTEADVPNDGREWQGPCGWVDVRNTSSTAVGMETTWQAQPHVSKMPGCASQCLADETCDWFAYFKRSSGHAGSKCWTVHHKRNMSTRDSVLSATRATTPFFAANDKNVGWHAKVCSDSTTGPAVIRDSPGTADQAMGQVCGIKLRTYRGPGVRANTPARDCQDAYEAGGRTNSTYWVTGSDNKTAPFEVFCQMVTGVGWPEDGGWMLTGALCDPRTFPFLTANDYAMHPLLEAGSTSPRLHRSYQEMTGSKFRIGVMVANGENTGNVFEINSCTPGDAACWYGAFLNLRGRKSDTEMVDLDGETFGAWVAAGGKWNHVPADGCLKDDCAAAYRDRDHSSEHRIVSAAPVLLHHMPPGTC